MSAQVLNTFSKSIVYQTFDPKNRDHMVAYACLVKYGRQHPTIRFQLEVPHLDILTMMHLKVALNNIDALPGVAEEAADLIGKRVKSQSIVDGDGVVRSRPENDFERACRTGEYAAKPYS